MSFGVYIYIYMIEMDWNVHLTLSKDSPSLLAVTPQWVPNIAGFTDHSLLTDLKK